MRFSYRNLVILSLLLLTIVLIEFYLLISSALPISNPSINSLVQSTLPNFIATLVGVILSLVFFQYIEDARKHVEPQNTDKQFLQKVMETLGLNKILGGIVAVEEQFEYSRFEELVKNGKNIRIMTTIIRDLNDFSRILELAYKNGASLEILQLDPDSSTFEKRCQALQADKEAANAYVNQFKALLKKYHEADTNFGRKIKIRLYDSTTSIRVYQCDEVAYVGFWIHGQTAKFAPHLKINANFDKTIFDVVERDFKWCWENATKEFDFDDTNYKKVKAGK